MLDLCSRLLYTIYTLTGPASMLVYKYSQEKNMDKDCARTHKKLDKIQDDIHEIKLDVQKNTQDLVYHIRRTDLLEKKMNFYFIKEISIIIGIGAAVAKLLGLF